MKEENSITIDQLIDEICPYTGAEALVWRDGFKHAFTLFLHKEKFRHQQDIDDINKDLKSLGFHGVNLSKIGEYIKV